MQRGQVEDTSAHACLAHTHTQELPPCNEVEDWSGCTLREFMDCPCRLATDGQVCVLADLRPVGCHNLSFIPKSKWAHLLLKSNKKNLWAMAFFGLMEFQRTFNLKFIWPFL